jgi:hypothetical protein
LAPEDIPNIEHLVTEDDTPVDNIFSEKEQHLLVDSLYTSWAVERPFLAVVNVGLFYAIHKPPLVPDFMLSLDVEVGNDFSKKENRSYFMWILGKAPDVVGEIVSNREGEELGDKLRLYAQIGIPFYFVHDPEQILGKDILRVFGLQRRRYEPIAADWLAEIGLGLKLWQGEYAGCEGLWLRWCDRQGIILPTGAEKAREEQRQAEEARRRAEEAEQHAQESLAWAEQERRRTAQERERAEQEHQRAEQERQRAEQERQRAERLAEKLRQAGIDPGA